ncbi:hypothetical protein ACGFJ7_45195 [Actinoplanes sp. NPDC048988]|uniref:hypothetical protein n=1 Tax=Actinoplanes sp. NPDC048988 TaxID=3363901 RepID=UPI003720E83D
MTAAAAPPSRAGVAETALGAALLLILVAYVCTWFHQQIEWRTGTAVPAAWWLGGKAAGTLGTPLFFAAAGWYLGRRRPAVMGWYVLSALACAALLWRFGPVYGLSPIRDLPEFVSAALLPSPGLAPVYALGVFPLIAAAGRRVPTWTVLGIIAGAVVAADLLPAPAVGTVLTYLLFFLAGQRLGTVLESLSARASLCRFLLYATGLAVVATAAGTAGDWTRPLVELAALPGAVTGAALLAERPLAERGLSHVTRGAAVIAATMTPAVALAGAVLVKRLSSLGGTAQTVVAVVDPLVLTAGVVTAGLLVSRLLSRMMTPAPLRVTR